LFAFAFAESPTTTATTAYVFVAIEFCCFVDVVCGVGSVAYVISESGDEWEGRYCVALACCGIEWVS